MTVRAPMVATAAVVDSAAVAAANADDDDFVADSAVAAYGVPLSACSKCHYHTRSDYTHLANISRQYHTWVRIRNYENYVGNNPNSAVQDNSIDYNPQLVEISARHTMPGSLKKNS